MDWDINSQLIDIQQYLLDVTAGHSVRFLMDFTLNDHRQTAVDSDYRLKVEYETKVHHKG